MKTLGRIAREAVAARSLEIEVVAGRTRSLIARADAPIAVSGSPRANAQGAPPPSQPPSRSLKDHDFPGAVRAVSLTDPLVVDGAINGEPFLGWVR